MSPAHRGDGDGALHIGGFADRIDMNARSLFYNTQECSGSVITGYWPATLLIMRHGRRGIDALRANAIMVEESLHTPLFRYLKMVRAARGASRALPNQVVSPQWEVA